MKTRIPYDVKIPEMAAEYTHHVYLVLSHLNTPTLILAYYDENGAPYCPAWASEYTPIAEPVEVTFTCLEASTLVAAAQKVFQVKREQIEQQYRASCASLEKSARAASITLTDLSST